MAKYKSLIVTTLLSVAALTGAVTTGVVRNRSMASSFEGDGYIVNVAETEEGLTAEPVYFSAGTKYKKTYPDEAVFKDIRGTKYTVDQDSFVHYQDGSMSAMTPGVVLNLDDVNGGLVNTYSFDAGTVLASNGNGYTAENNGTSIPFDNFVWKLSDDRYYVYSDNLQVETVNGTMEDMSGGVQVDYLEDGIIRLSSENSAWQGIAAGAKAITGDGATLSFDDKVITDAQGNDRMTLGELLMDADDNIKVQSAQDWVPPEFDFTTIDGENGQIGADGAAGQAGDNGENGAAGASGEMGENGVDGEEGDSGEDGDDGSDGSSGRNGSAGSNGKLGGDGANGSIPQNQATEQATITLSEFNIEKGTASGTIHITDEDGVLEPDSGCIRVINVSSGLDMRVLVNETEDAKNLTFAADDDLTFSVANLNADTQYRLIVSSRYSLSENGGETSGGTKDFINRVFYTDSTGISLELDNASTTGFSYTIDAKDYAEIPRVQITITDKKGAIIYGPEENELKIGTKNQFTVDMKNDQVEGLKESDLADGTYTVTMKLSGSGVEKEVKQTWKTLKMTPELGTPTVDVNSGGYFEITQPIVSDPNKALTKYRYEIYKGGTLVKFIETTNSDHVTLYLEKDKIERNVSYTLKTFATYYDNEKNVTIETDYSKAFRMDDQGASLVYFVHADETDSENHVDGKLVTDSHAYTHQNTVWGTVVIKPKNLNLKIDQNYPLKVTMESSGDYRRTWTIRNPDYYKQFNDALTLEIEAHGLKASSNYRIFVTGFAADTYDPTHVTNVYLGDYVVSTTAYADPNPTTIKLVRVADDINASFTARMEMTTKNGAPTVETDVLDQLEFCLYQGSNSSGLLVGTFTLDDTNPLHNVSSISDQYLNKTDAKDQYVITNQNFNLSNSALTGTSYYLEVRAAYDYTASFYKDGGTEDGGGENLSGFKNKLPYVLSGVELPISNALPSLPQPTNEAIQVTKLTAGDLRGDSSYQSIQDQLENLADETVVGYRLAARLNNDNGYARAIRYFGFKTSELDKFNPQTSDATDPVKWGDGSHYDFAYPMKVPDGASMPELQVLFLEAPDSVPAANYADLDPEDRKYIKNVDMKTSDNAYETDMDGYTTVFTGREAGNGGLKRGYHYTFGFKVRMQVENTSILYPDDYKQEIIGGIGMLSSLSVGAPRQDTSVAMYLKEILGDGTDSNPYRARWNLKVLQDIDKTWDNTYKEVDSDQTSTKYTSGMRLISRDGLNRTPTITSQGTGTNEYQIDVPIGNSVTRYQFKMYQKYYEDDTATDKSTSSGQFLASHEYAPPAELNLTNPEDQGNVTVTASFPAASNEVTFTLTGNTTILSRIVALNIQLYNDQGAKVYEWSKATLSPLDATSRSTTVDLTNARPEGTNLSGVYSFKIQASYADGFYGMPDSFDANKTYAAKVVDGDAFMNNYYYSSSTQGENYEYNLMNYPYLTRGGYTIKENTTETAAQEADKKLLLQSKYDWDYSSSRNLWHTMNLYYGKAGAEWLVKEDQKSGTGYNMAFCQIRNTDGYLPLTKITGPDGQTGPTISIGTLQPSITNMYISQGITASNFTFTTGSYALIAPPAKGTDIGTKNGSTGRVQADGNTKYVLMKLYELSESEDVDTDISTREPVWERAIPLEEGQTSYAVDRAHMSDLYVEDGLLKQNTKYKLVCYTWIKNGNQVEQLMMLGQGAHNLANYVFRTIDTIGITDGEAGNIVYDSYQEKSVTVRYHLDRVNGYQLKYELRRYPLGEGKKAETSTNYTVAANHEQVMETLLGYKYDQTSNTWKKGAITWSLVGNMEETLNLAPGNNLMVPGYDYVLVVDAVDGSDTSVSTNKMYIPITWQALRRPVGNVSFRITNGTTLWADVSLSDPNQVVVPDGQAKYGEYIIAYREAGSNDKWIYKDTCLVNNSTSKDIVKTEADLMKSWEVGIFAQLDMNNEGNKNALTESRFNGLSETQQNSYLIASAKKDKLESWGGSLGDYTITLSGGSLTMSLAKAYNLGKVEKIIYTLMPWGGSSDSQVSGELTKNGNASLFKTYGSGTNQYDLLSIPLGIKKDGALWAVSVQMYGKDENNKDILILDYSRSIPSI